MQLKIKVNEIELFTFFSFFLIILLFIFLDSIIIFSIGFLLLLILIILTIKDGIKLALLFSLIFSPLLPYKYHINKFANLHFGGSADHLVITPVYLAFIFLTIVILFFYRRDFFKEFEIEKTLLIWIIFSVYAFIIAIPVAQNLAASFFEVLKMLIAASFSIMAYKFINSKKDLRNVLILIAFVLILQGFIAILQQFRILPLDLLMGEEQTVSEIRYATQIFRRSTGTLREPNTLGKLLSLYIPVFVILPLVSKKKKYKILFSFTLLISIGGLLLTFGRSAIVGTIMGSVFSLFLLGKFAQEYLPSKKIIISGISLIIVSIAVFSIFLFELLYLRFITFGLATVSGRIALIENSLHIIKNNFFTGIGINNYTDYMIMHDHSGVAAVNPRYPVHNIYLLYFAEVGIFGFLLFVSFLMRFFYKNFNYLKKREFDIHSLAIAVGGAGGLSSILLQGLFGWGFRTFNIYSIFLLIGLILSAHKIKSKKPTNVQSNT